MYIIIVGGGRIGHFLAKRLWANKHTVVLIERDKNLCDAIAKELDIIVVNGDGCESYCLEEAGIFRADVVVASTNRDEDNLVICQLAKEKFKVRRTVAKVNDPKNEVVFSELGADVSVDVTEIIAKIIEEEVSFDDFVNLLSFNRGKIAIIRIDLTSDSPVINKKISEIDLPPDSVLVTILRQDKVIVPKGNTVLCAGDDVVALTPVENKQTLLRFLLGKFDV